MILKKFIYIEGEKMRMVDIKAQIPEISDKVLVENIRFLVDSKVMIRDENNNYALTPIGTKMVVLKDQIVVFGVDYLKSVQQRNLKS